MITKTRPTTISSISFARGRIRFQRSIVNITEHELNTEVNDDIKAAIITATMRPLAPAEYKFKLNILWHINNKMNLYLASCRLSILDMQYLSILC